MLLGIITQAPWAERTRSEYSLDDPQTLVVTSVVCHGEIMAISEKRKWGDRKRAKLVELLYDGVPAIDINRQPILNAYAKIDTWTRGSSVVDQQTPPPKPAVKMTKNDLWIAATAHSINATLLSTDRGFRHIHSTWIDFIYVDQRSR